MREDDDESMRRGLAKEELQTPTVFMFRPTQYVKVPSEQLEKWEGDLRRATGFPGRLTVDAARARSGTETWSICYGDWGWDDCDEI